nr:nephrin-like [Lepeophtheirus salmonis]
MDKIKRVTTVEGGRVDLPCDITTPAIGDSVYLVLWYRKDSGTPIYSYDSRQTTEKIIQDVPERPDLWSEPSAFGDRAHFRVSSNPATLSVTDVHRLDAGTYTCRVDFRQSPTIYHHITLDIIVPPQQPLILDDRGREVKGTMGIGPFREGDSLTLECHVPGGEPLPSVLWYMDDVLMDDTFQQTYEGTVKNGLTIRKLERKHTESLLRCLASNNNITRPKESHVQLKMFFPPQGVKIQGPLQPYTSGRVYYISCVVWGSNPPANIKWYRGIKGLSDLVPLSSYNQTVTHSGNVSLSWIKYLPLPSHQRDLLICRGSNQELMGHQQFVEDFHRLEIFYAPNVMLTLGRMVNPKDLEEGDDVYFSCNIDANPAAYKLTWRHNGEEVTQDINKGIIIANQSLVLQRIRRDQAGSYSCEASNVEGDEVSSPVAISIMYRPVCVKDQKTIYGVSEHETAHISCKVDAHPQAESFSWSFNTSSGGMNLPRNSFTNKGSGSLLSYTPQTQMDYGTVLCWAENMVGMQLLPCIYHVIPASQPDPPRNCSVVNQTHDSLEVDCEAGFSSGLKQEFHMEVFRAKSRPEHQLLINITAKTPKLVARGLPQGQALFLRVYASNAKGRSRSSTFDGYTLKMADKHPVVDSHHTHYPGKYEEGEQWSMFLVIVLSAALTLLIIGIAIALLAKIGRRNEGEGAPVGPGGFIRDTGHHYRTEHPRLDKSFGDTPSLMEPDKSPDIIPHFNASGFANESSEYIYGPSSGNETSLIGSPSSKKQHVDTNSTLEVPSNSSVLLLKETPNYSRMGLSRENPLGIQSPAGTSDSSGFSERGGGVEGIFAPAYLSGGTPASLLYGRAAEIGQYSTGPNTPFTNSPYLSLSRRGEKVPNSRNVNARTPLLDDDRESCV